MVAASGSGSSEANAALERLYRGYLEPLYAYIRRRGYAREDAQDLVQEFFRRLVEKKSLSAADRQKGKFRSFLLGSLNNFLADQHDRRRAAKRGGGQPLASLDEEAAERRYALEVAAGLSPEEILEKHWAATVLELAAATLREEFEARGKGRIFERLKAYFFEPTARREYAGVGTELGLSANMVAVTVHRARQRYGELVRAEIAKTVGSPKEIEEERRHLLAVLSR